MIKNTIIIILEIILPTLVMNKLNILTEKSFMFIVALVLMIAIITKLENILTTLYKMNITLGAIVIGLDLDDKVREKMK